MKWFVILRGQNDQPLPMVSDEDWLAVFGTEAEATEAAEQNPLGKAYGFEVYSWLP